MSRDLATQAHERALRQQWGAVVTPQATPRPLPDPTPIAWFAVVLTMLAAGVVGGSVAWLISRRLGL